MNWGEFATGHVTTAQVIRACDQEPPSWCWRQCCFMVPKSQALSHFLNQAANLNGLNILMIVHNWLSKDEGVHTSRHTRPSHIFQCKGQLIQPSSIKTQKKKSLLYMPHIQLMWKECFYLSVTNTCIQSWAMTWLLLSKCHPSWVWLDAQEWIDKRRKETVTADILWHVTHSLVV